MENKLWMVLVRTSLVPGSGVFRTELSAPDPWTAMQMAKGMYGALLLSESATPIYSDGST